jgi:hypothetical protein
LLSEVLLFVWILRAWEVPGCEVIDPTGTDREIAATEAGSSLTAAAGRTEADRCSFFISLSPGWQIGESQVPSNSISNPHPGWNIITSRAFMVPFNLGGAPFLRLVNHSSPD